MRVLVIAGDHWHPAVTVHGGLAPLVAKGYELDWMEDAADWAAEQMADHRLVILSKSDNVTEVDQTSWVMPEVEQAFADYVRGGRWAVGAPLRHGVQRYGDTATADRRHLRATPCAV